MISSNSLFEYGKRQNVVRYFGVANNEKEYFRFDVCAPSDDCLSGYGYIELCFLTNVTTRSQKGNCPDFFSSFKLQYYGKQKIFNVSEAMSNDTYFRMVGYYTYYYHFFQPSVIPKNMKFYRKGIKCLTAYHEVDWMTNKTQIRFAQPDDPINAVAEGADPWITVPFGNEIHPFQTAIIFQDSSPICTPSIYVNLPEYIRIENSESDATTTTTTTTKATTKKPTPTTTFQSSKTPLKEGKNVTKAFDGFLSSQDWIPMIIVAIFVCLLIPQFIIGSIILNKKSNEKADNFYLMVLEMRQNVRKEIQQNQKEALVAEKTEEAKELEERKRKINQMKEKLSAELPADDKNKGLIQIPKNSKAGSSRIGKREVLPNVEGIGGGTLITGASTKETENSVLPNAEGIGGGTLITVASTKETENSGIQLVKDVASETGSHSTKNK
uniref:Uncharacterized protein n=1 Tax=Panagrolaimus sp. PS1159 TaxID=55785 RepID=A0AC35F334_9BILA